MSHSLRVAVYMDYNVTGGNQTTRMHQYRKDSKWDYKGERHFM